MPMPPDTTATSSTPTDASASSTASATATTTATERVMAPMYGLPPPENRPRPKYGMVAPPDGNVP